MALAPGVGPVQPVLLGPPTTLNQQPANAPVHGVIHVDVAAGAADQAVRNYVQTLRHRAGPQLCPNLPPWYRPGPVAGPQHQPAWPGRAPNYSIPLRVAPNSIPDIHTYQDGLNTFLGMADDAFGGSLYAANAVVSTNNLGHASLTDLLDKTRRGPRVYRRQVSTVDRQDRRAAFAWHRAGQRDMFGGQPGAVPNMSLAEYSSTFGEFKSFLRLAEGTLVSVASQEAQGPVTLSSAYQQFQAGLPAGVHTGLPVAPAGAAVQYWHAAGVFLQSRRHYPVPVDPTRVPLNATVAQRWRWDGRLRCCFVYDPSYINETPGPGGPGLVRQRLALNQESRVGNHHMLSVVNRLLYGPHGLAPPRGHAAARWIRDYGSTKIGGGGNIGGVDECQRMTSIWMLQVGELSRALSRAIYTFYYQPNGPNEQAFLQAEAEWQRFFVDYTELRP